MERHYYANKGTVNANLFPHPHTRTFMSVEGEYQGANTPLGFQHLVDYLSKTTLITPLDVLEIILANLTKRQFSNHTAKELSLWHYEATINGNSANQNSERDDFVALQNQIGFPSSCRKVGIGQGSSMARPYTAIDPNSPMFHIRQTVANGILFPVLKFSYFREYWSYFTPLNSNYAKLASRKEGFSVSIFGHIKFFNIIGNYNKRNTVIYNSKSFDSCPASLLTADLTFDKSGAKFLYSTIANITNPGSSNSYYHQGTAHSFAPTTSALDLHDPLNPSLEADLNFNLLSNGLLKSQEQNGILIDSKNKDFGYPHLSYPNNHYAITPFDAIWAVGDNTKADNHFHVEDPQSLMSDFMVGEVAPEHLYLSNRIIDEALPTYSYFNIYSGTSNASNQYQAAFDCRRILYCGKEVYTIESKFPNGTNVPIKQLSPNGNFTIGKNADVNFTAGEEINLLPGFESQFGSNFSATIVSHNCSNEFELSKSTGFKQNSNVELDENHAENKTQAQFQNTEIKSKLKLFPTPAEASVFVEGIPSDEIYQVSIRDVFGRELAHQELNVKQNEIALSNLPSGAYLMIFKNKSIFIQAEKIVIQKP